MLSKLFFIWAGLLLVVVGVLLYLTGQPEKGDYLYPAEVRAEALAAAREISDPVERQQLIDTIEARQTITHTREILLACACVLCGVVLCIFPIHRAREQRLHQVVQSSRDGSVQSA